ncbi:exopolysaccharide biosynthesis protein [Pikeienuella piscinae]|uniref:Exopolysaccharide biosynthesis protein n=1 Tax=Pikeienuella piscinae TaxID=2748098 RepID=A0A7L5BVV0_9RHOB|nr:exopolysaccharide biosynthesis protein [Pikeienuella piscinae]QIE54948.1 exopolysaccharide biosynthesis protein [Pikeienuella piscinae]
MPGVREANVKDGTPPDASVEQILNDVRSLINGGSVSVDEIVTNLGGASFAPLLFLPAAAVVSPLSGVPGFSSLCGLMIAVVAAQMVAARGHLWLPGWLRRRRIPSDRLRKALGFAHRPARFLDRVTRRRLAALVEPPFSALPSVVCLLCGLAMPFLELVPFTSSILGFAVAVLAVSALARDGLFALLALIVIGSAAATGLSLVA